MNTGRAADTSKNVGPLRTLLDLKAPAFVPVTISASKNASGNSQTDLANKDPNLLKSSQVAGDLQPTLLTHPPQTPERCQANLLYCETRKLEMRSTAQIWWAQASRREKTVLFSCLFATSFRKWKPFVSYKEGDDNVACKSKPIVTSPNHCNGTKAPRKGYLPPWASYSPASLRYCAESGPPAKAWPLPTDLWIPPPTCGSYIPLVPDLSRPPDVAWLRALCPPVAEYKAWQASNHPARPEIVSHYESGGAFIGGNGRYEQ